MHDQPPPLPPSPPPPQGFGQLPPTGTGKSRTGCIIGAVVAGVVGLALISILVAIAVPAFNKLQRKSEERRQRNETATKPPEPLTAGQKQKLQTFGEQVAADLSEGKVEPVDRRVDLALFSARVFQDTGGHPAMTGARTAFEREIGTKSLFRELAGHDIKCLRVRERDGFPSVLLRILMGDTGVNYVELICLPEEASFKIIDLYGHLFASFVSGECRMAMLPVMSKLGGAGLGALFGSLEGEGQQLVNEMLKMTRMRQGGDYAGVQTAYARLPEKARNMRIFFLIHLQALQLSQNSSPEIDAAYLEALEKAPDILGKESSLDLLLLDQLILRNDFDGAIQSLDRISKRLGGDAYLDVLRGGLMAKQGDLDGASRMALSAEKAEPEMVSIIDLRLAIRCARKDFTGVVSELRRLKLRYGKAFGRADLHEAMYEEFLQSPEFAAWEREQSR